MTKHTLSAEKREVLGRKVKQLRTSGLIPANIFGKNISSVSIQINTKDFHTVYKEAGESTLVYLTVKGEKLDRPVFVRDAVVHPVTGRILHVVFHQVDLKEKVTAPVRVLLEGDAPAEKEKLGILVQQTNDVEVEALPTDMPENITLDVSSLTEVGSSLSISDIKSSPKYKVITDPETIIVKIEPLAAEEKEEAPVLVETPEGEAAPAEGLPAETEAKEGEAAPAPTAEEKPAQ